MKTGNWTKNTVTAVREPLETLKSQLVEPILTEAATELGGFFGMARPNRNPKEIAKDELARARNKEKIDQEESEDKQTSQEMARRISAVIENEYKTQQVKIDKEQQVLKEEVGELQAEVVKLAKAAGIETKAHLETIPQKVGVLHIKRLTAIVRFLRIKAEESKSAKELVDQRSNAKRTTGMLAWVSGKQMRVHEQGTLLLQG